MQPAVSIVISYYRQSKFLLDAVRSALAQTYSNVDVIVVDDCCPDASALELLEPCAGAGLKVLRHAESLGLAPTRNTGVNSAGGQLIVSLDGDDMLAPNYLEAMVPLLEDDSIAAVYSRVQYIGAEEGTWLPKLSLPDSLFEGIPATFLYRKKVFEELGGYDLRACAAPDRPFVISLLRAGYKMIAADQPLYRRRKHDGQFTARLSAAAEIIRCSLAVHGDLYEQYLAEVVAIGAAAWGREASKILQTKCELQELNDLSRAYADFAAGN